MMTFSSQYKIKKKKKVFYVLTITVDKNNYFHPSSVISPLKDFTVNMRMLTHVPAARLSLLTYCPDCLRQGQNKKLCSGYCFLKGL